jgi:hypothetical protein
VAWASVPALVRAQPVSASLPVSAWVRRVSALAGETLSMAI